MRSNSAKNFDILATSLSVLHNYFNNPTKFVDVYLAKILDTSTMYCSYHVRISGLAEHSLISKYQFVTGKNFKDYYLMNSYFFKF